MTAVDLDLTVYPVPVVDQGILAYRGLADILIQRSDGHNATLVLVNHSRHDETRVVDEFLNHLLALMIKSPPGL